MTTTNAQQVYVEHARIHRIQDAYNQTFHRAIQDAYEQDNLAAALDYWQAEQSHLYETIRNQVGETS